MNHSTILAVRLALWLVLGVAAISCEQVQGTTTPVDTTPIGPPPEQPTGQEPSDGVPPAVRIEMNRQDRFFPDVVIIRPGQTVEWSNDSDRIHTVTDDAASAIHAEDVETPPGAAPFDSGYLNPGQSYRHRFVQEGTYRYVCYLHETEGMSGTIVVTTRTEP